MQKSGIYIILSKVHPERVYIGSAVNVPARWNRHRRELKKKVHHNAKLTNHVTKYGLDDLICEILFSCSIQDLIKFEQIVINNRNPFFNINPSAGSRLGAKHSNQSKIKISRASLKGPKESINRKYSRLTGIKS